MRVAVVGAGPGGLAAARWLKSRGFEPVLFEAADDVGGQWNCAGRNSGVWPSMRTNTARMVTRFSDLDYDPRTPVFPHNRDVHAYLRRYAETFGLLDGARLGTTVTGLSRAGSGYRMSYEAAGAAREEEFDRVVVASGRYNLPEMPAVDGLDSFAGELGAIHAFAYKDPEHYRGRRVLVAGGNISSLEIASDLAMLGASAVATTMRRQRYVMPKLIAGIPVESYGFTRAGALWQEAADSEEYARGTLAFVLQYGGDPARYGAPRPHADVRVAGTTGSQNFLNLVAEGRIACHPWIERVSGRTVTFVDGHSAEFDGIVFGTGYALNLPFLDAGLRGTLGVTRHGLDLVENTFHPALPGLAFVGLWCQVGPYLPPLEQQARLLAYVWSGEAAMPPAGALRASGGEDVYQHIQTLRFARLNGSDPQGRVPAALQRLLDQTAVTALTCRLAGPDALADAPASVVREARRFGRPDLDFSDLVPAQE